jgi:hypothetical protein
MTELEGHADRGDAGQIDVKPGPGRAGVERSEPGGRAERDAGAPRRTQGVVAGEELAVEVRDRLSDELVDELLAGARSEEEIVGPGGLLSRLTKRLVERAMEVELTDRLGYEHGQAPRGGERPQRNDVKDACDRARAGPDRRPAGSQGHV